MMCLNQLISISLILKQVVCIISANFLYLFRLLYLCLAKKGVFNFYISFVFFPPCRFETSYHVFPIFTQTHWHRHKSFAFKNENTVLHISLKIFSYFYSRDNVLRNFANKLDAMIPFLYEVNFCYYLFVLFILIG